MSANTSAAPAELRWRLLVCVSAGWPSYESQARGRKWVEHPAHGRHATRELAEQAARGLGATRVVEDLHPRRLRNAARRLAMRRREYRIDDALTFSPHPGRTAGPNPIPVIDW